MEPNGHEASHVLEVINLTKRYGDVVAVAGVDFSLEKGEILGLLGPNGAGKTSILETIEGLRQPDGGIVRLFGEAEGARSRSVRARIGIQLQASAMLPNLTVAELLGLQASFFPAPLATSDVLATIGLTDKARAMSSSLSGGQLQRLAIGLALIGDPDLVLLDEPTTGLDPASRRELWTVLEGLRAGGRSVLLTTHYMEEAEALCDRVAIMDRGRIVATGSVPDLAARQGGERIVFDSRPGLDVGALSALAGVTNVVRRNGQTALLTADAGQTLIDLVDHSRALGYLPEGLAVRRPTLEEIYLELTGHALHAANAA